MSPADEPPTRLRVLVVEDNHDGAEMLSTLLSVFGHEPFIAREASSGLRAVVEFAPDVALLDIGLPGIDGYELARRIHQVPGYEQLPLVAISGWGLEEDVKRATEAGFDHHLTKPASPDSLEQLLQAIASRLRGKRAGA